MQRFETKYDLLNAAYKDSQLKKGTVLLLQYLVHKSDKKKCFPSIDTIAKALNVCRRTVQYNMRKLEKAGYIIRKDRWYNHQQLTNQYVFNLGIVEDVPGPCRYTDAEKKSIADCFINIPDHQDGIKDEICQDKNSRGKIDKAAELLKIYHMPLSGREKLLLIYLFHRANKKGMIYDIPEAYMNAIGVRYATLTKLINKLRDKNLIRVRCTRISGRTMILIKLTGNVWQEKQAAANHEIHGVHDIQKHTQGITQNQKPDAKASMQPLQRERGVKMILKLLQRIFKKIRMILRL